MKRDYWELGPKTRWCVRVTCRIALPFVLIWACADRFWQEFKNCCWHTRQEGRIVLADFHAFIKDTKIPPPGEPT